MSRRRVWHPDELRALIGPLASQYDAEGDDTGECVQGAERVPWRDLPSAVRDVLHRYADLEDGDGRYRACFHIVQVCRETGLTPDQTLGVIEEHHPPSVEKFGHRLAEQVEKYWNMKGHRVPHDWDEPIELAHQPEPLPIDALGPILGPLVAATAEAIQVPTDLVANAALPIITTAIRGRWSVRINDSWSESLSLASVSALASGERKSAVVRVLLAPLRELERAAQEEIKAVVVHDELVRGLDSDRVENLRKKAKSGDYEAQQEYVQAAEKLAAHEPTPLPRWFADDVTPERLTRLLAEQGGALGIISTEPTLFRILSGRYTGGKANIEAVLAATSGDPIRVDRQGQESVLIDHTALSISLCVQPDLLADFGQGSFRGSGLLARFLYVMPKPAVGTRTIIDRPVPGAVREKWASALRSIVETVDKIDNSRSVPDKDASSVNIVNGFRWLRVDDRARRLLNDFRVELEPKLHPQRGELAGVADWGSKLPGAIVRIAAALTLLENAHAEVIVANTMADAIRLGRAYISHARAAFGSMHGRNDERRRADEVLGWLRDQGQATFSLRDVHRPLQGRAWVNSASDVKAVLHTLIEYGHVREIEAQKGSRGRPSQRYELHPQHIDNIDKKGLKRDSNAVVDDIDEKSHPGKTIDNIDNTPVWECGACGSQVDLEIDSDGEVWVNPHHVKGCPRSITRKKGETVLRRGDLKPASTR